MATDRHTHTSLLLLYLLSLPSLLWQTWHLFSSTAQCLFLLPHVLSFSCAIFSSSLLPSLHSTNVALLQFPSLFKRILIALYIEFEVLVLVYKALYLCPGLSLHYPSLFPLLKLTAFSLFLPHKHHSALFHATTYAWNALPVSDLIKIPPKILPLPQGIRTKEERRIIVCRKCASST